MITSPPKPQAIPASQKNPPPAGACSDCACGAAAPAGKNEAPANLLDRLSGTLLGLFGGGLQRAKFRKDLRAARDRAAMARLAAARDRGGCGAG